MGALNFSDILILLQSQGYLIMLVIMIFEGPMITSVAAFAASLGYFNIYAVLALSVLGNMIGDLMYYSIGRLGRKVVIDRYFKRHGLGKRLIAKFEAQLKKHPGKLLTIIKVIPPLPTPGLILAGVTKMKLRTFLIYTTTISFFFSLFFALMGYYLGKAFYSVFQYTEYLQYGVLLVILVNVLILWLYSKYSKKIYAKMSRTTR
jgi:membrane-associated protein